MKSRKEHPPVLVKNLDDDDFSVLSAPDVNPMHQIRAFGDITEGNTNPVSSVRIAMITNGLRVVDTYTKNTSRSMD